MRVFILCLLTARLCLGQQYHLTIQDFEALYNKTYGSAEEEAAAANNLAANEAEINAQNEKFANGEATFDEAVQEWDDLSEEEFLNKMTGLILPPEDERVNTPEALAHFDHLRKMNNREELPAFWDSRDPSLTNSPSGWITPVKKQSCGSCTAFATNAAAEAALVKAGADPSTMDISEQWLLNCSPYGSGCNGAWPSAYAKWVPMQGVLMHENDYPYTGTADKNNCQDGPYWNPGYKITNFIEAHECSDEDMMMQIKTYGSIVMTLVVENGFGNYNSGVFNGCASPENFPNHSVLAVGWGTLNGVDYWLIKNSWGTNWGDGGYIRVKRGTCNTNYGCTMYTAAASNVCSTDSPCGADTGHCESNEQCQSGDCGSKNCPAIQTCSECADLSPVANCCNGGNQTTTAAPASCTGNLNWIGDDYCDDELNNAACEYDKGDCCDNSKPNWDHYCSTCQCLTPTTTTTLAPCTGNLDWIGDDYCDDELNNASCEFDKGDCCNNSKPNWDHYCSVCQCLS